MEKITRFLYSYHIEKLAWCLFTIAFCWTDVADYDHMIYNKKLCIWILVGIYYLWKQGYFQRKYKKIVISCIVVGTAIEGFFLVTNYFSHYTFYNYTMGILATVLLLQYVFLIKQFIQRRLRFNVSIVSVCALLMIVFTQFSPNVEKENWSFLFLILFPYIFMQVTKDSVQDIFEGMIDGMCIGFLICQTYTFLFRPYVFDEQNGVRFRAFRNYCTYAGVSYLQFYVAYVFKYLLLTEKKAAKWKRGLIFVTAAFVLSLLYLTGGRSPVIGVVVITAILFAWKYKRVVWYKAVFGWAIQCIVLAMLSFLLFPVAYAGTRYLPTIVNHPDLQDSEDNRLYSFSTIVLKQKFLYNGEWNMWSVKANMPANSARYVSFEECVDGTLCRIVPGLEKIVKPAIREKLLETQINRIIELYEEGYVDFNYLNAHIISYANSQTLEIPEYAVKYLEKEQKQISALEFLKLSASKSSKDMRGSSIEYGWFEDGQVYTAMELRNAIHTYAFRNLNLFGHERNSFQLYYRSGSELYIGHAHNVFLIMGYDYGIFCMLFMGLTFILLSIKSVHVAFVQHRACLLLPFILILGMTIYGWFESGFGVGNSYSELILLCAVLFQSRKHRITHK